MQFRNNTTLLWVLCFIVLLPLTPLLFGYFPAIGDMRDVFIPLEIFFRQQQLQGDIPAWNPAISFGFPVIAAAQIGFFYPILFILRFLPIYLELPIALGIHVCAAAVGTYVFARRLSLSREASMLAAISFTLSQFIWQHSTHLNIFFIIAWFPWQMLAVHTLFQKDKLYVKHIVLLTALFAMPFFIGQIQMPFLMMLVGLLYGLWTGATIRTCLLVAASSILFASVQLLPTLELANLSSRNSPGEFDSIRANQHSYPLYHLPTFLFPRFYGSDDTYWGKRLEIEYGSYIGVLPFMLVVWYFWNRKRNVVIPARQARHDSGFFVLLLITSFLLSLGSLSPFRLIGIEPSLWIFSAPARWLFFTTFAASMLAGFAYDAIWTHIVSAKKFFRTAAIVIIAGVIIGNIVLFVIPITPLSQLLQAKSLPATLAGDKLEAMVHSAKSSSISIASPYTYIVLIPLIVLPYAISHKKSKQIILAITTIDLVLVAITTTPLIPWNQVLTPPQIIAKLPQNIIEHNARIHTIPDGADTGAYFTNPASRPTMQKRLQQKELLLPLISSQFGIYGTQWPASLDIQQQTEALEQLNPMELNIGAILYPTGYTGIVMLPQETQPRVQLVSGEAYSTSETPDTLIIRTNSSTATSLIVRDTFYPGWHAYIDEKETQLDMQKPFFRKVSVPAGEHIVEMKYVPKMLYIGGGVTLIILLICAIILLL